MNLLQSRNRPTWRDEVLAVPVVFTAIVVMIVLELWGSAFLKGNGESL